MRVSLYRKGVLMCPAPQPRAHRRGASSTEVGGAEGGEPAKGENRSHPAAAAGPKATVGEFVGFRAVSAGCATDLIVFSISTDAVFLWRRRRLLQGALLCNGLVRYLAGMLTNQVRAA